MESVLPLGVLLLPACSPFEIREQGVQDFTVGPFPVFWDNTSGSGTWAGTPAELPDPAFTDWSIACWRYAGGGARCAPVWGSGDFPERTVEDMHWVSEQPVEEVLHTPFGPVWIDPTSRTLQSIVTCRHAAEAVRVCTDIAIPDLSEFGPVDRVTTTWYQVCALSRGEVLCYPGFRPELPFEPVEIVSARSAFDTCALAADGRWACWDHRGPADLPGFPSRVEDLWPGLAPCALTSEQEVWCVPWHVADLAPDFESPLVHVASDIVSMGGHHEVHLVHADGHRLVGSRMSGSFCDDEESGGRRDCGLRVFSEAWRQVEAGCYLSHEGELFCGGTEEDALRAAGL